MRRPVESGQYTSLAYTDRLDELGAAPSVGSRGDALDNAMTEAWVATFKAELVEGRRFPDYEQAERETLTWIGFYNSERLHEQLGDVPPAEFEALRAPLTLSQTSAHAPTLPEIATPSLGRKDTEQLTLELNTLTAAAA